MGGDITGGVALVGLEFIGLVGLSPRLVGLGLVGLRLVLFAGLGLVG